MRPSTVSLWNYSAPGSRILASLEDGTFAIEQLPSQREAMRGLAGVGALVRVGLLHPRPIVAGIWMEGGHGLLVFDRTVCSFPNSRLQRRTLFPLVKQVHFFDDAGGLHRYEYWWSDLSEDGMVDRDFIQYLAHVRASEERRSAFRTYWEENSRSG